MQTTLQPAQEVVLAARDQPERTASPRFSTSRDLKCFHCGFVAGQVIVEPDHGGSRRILRVSGQCPSEAVVLEGHLRCCRCGGPVYLDEVETVLRLRPEDLEKPRRGRKPKAKC